LICRVEISDLGAILTGERVERRLAAVLAADVAGYSRLMGLDEEGTLSRLKAVRKALVDPTIASHRGRIVKTTGDGMLVEFASAVDAARCAIEVQRGMAEQNSHVPSDVRIEFRIGVHIGDIIIDDNDIFGDGVNIAARLEGIAAPGGICISGSAYEHVQGRIETSFFDLGEKRLKNIARPIRVFGTQADDGMAASIQEKSGPPRLSIVVLPFANFGADSSQDYFADGITETLTTDLSRIRGSFIISRNTAFTYKGKAGDAKQIGRELNVRYVLEGSVQRSTSRLRVNVQLIDAENGNHLWAERFDKPAADLFELQDEIVAHLASQLDAELIAVEARRAERLPHPDSMDLYFQGTACWHRGPTADNLAKAQDFLSRALALDPNNVDALVGQAWISNIIGGNMVADDHAARYAAAEASATKALSLAPNHAMAHFMLGAAHALAYRAKQAIVECERALALDRNLAGAHAAIGLARNTLGHAEDTEKHIIEALRLSPRDVQAYVWMHLAGAAKIFLGEDEAAVSWYRRSIEANRNFALSHFFISAPLAQLGRLNEATEAVAVGLSLNPTFSIRRVQSNVFSDDPTYLAHRERLYDGLRKAGVPE
jgi:TolB-like protein/class 3 adenylate cyclase